VVDRLLLATKLAAIRDAVARLQEMLPDSADGLLADRTVREVVTFNLFLALQETISLAAHWLADEGVDVPATYGEAFTLLGQRGIIDRDLATRLRSAVGLRNLIAHQYGVLDFRRIFAIAKDESIDLLDFCQQLAARVDP
jgi:uncharacterized protein YutE (UPF0331/DUF86 family)